MSSPISRELLRSLPEPRIVREQIGRRLRETRLLRRLLRLSESVSAESRTVGEVSQGRIAIEAQGAGKGGD